MSTVVSEPQTPYIVDDGKSTTEESSDRVLPLPNEQFVARPPIDYSSVGAFFCSSWRRFLSIWTRRFTLSLLAGQVVSLCITCTNVTTEELTIGNWQLPTTQTFFLCPGFLISCMHFPSDWKIFRYFSLFVVYTPYTIYKCMSRIVELYVGVFLRQADRWLQGLVRDAFQRWVEVYAL